MRLSYVTSKNVIELVRPGQRSGVQSIPSVMDCEVSDFRDSFPPLITSRSVGLPSGRFPGNSVVYAVVGASSCDSKGALKDVPYVPRTAMPVAGSQSHPTFGLYEVPKWV